MAKKLYEEENIRAIAERIRQNAAALTAPTYTVAEMAHGVDLVYSEGFDNGYYEGEGIGYQDGWDMGWDDGWGYGYTCGEEDGWEWGFNDGYDAGVEDSAASGIKEFLKKYQKNGDRTDYNYAFRGDWWDDTTFQPTYNIVCDSAKSIFEESGISTIPVTLDISNCLNLEYAFNACCVETIKEMIVSEKTEFDITTFIIAESLKNVTVTGVIGKDLFMGNCYFLSYDSIVSIINALSNTTSGLSVTFSEEAKLDAFVDDEWEALVATKPNWTISLI